MSNYGDSEKILSDYNRRSSPPPFLLKTHMLIEDPSTDNVISWNSSGTAFVVWQPSEFARDILPKLFKHCNFSSFIRQLNTYGFRKVTSGRWEFQNEMFRRGQVELLSQIRRRKATSTKVRVESTEEQVHNESNEDRGSLSTQSSSEDTQDNLREENDRLRKENRVLSVELLDIKSKCKELYDLISIYKNSEQTMEDKTLKLFGVTLKVEADRKRKRSDIFETTCFSLSQTCK